MRRLPLEDKDMVGRQHSDMRVLLQSFHTPMRLEKLWVAMDSIASASVIHFAAGAQDHLRYGLI